MWMLILDSHLKSIADPALWSRLMEWRRPQHRTFFAVPVHGHKRYSDFVFCGGPFAGHFRMLPTMAAVDLFRQKGSFYYAAAAGAARRASMSR
jgi:hypothetical protein